MIIMKFAKDSLKKVKGKGRYSHRQLFCVFFKCLENNPMKCQKERKWRKTDCKRERNEKKK